MKTYVITILPRSPFGTPLKGDTIFGRFCWQAAENQSLLNKGLDYWIERYGEHPFAVFSSAWPVIPEGTRQYAVKKPELPSAYLGNPLERESCRDWHEKRKEYDAKKWLFLPGGLRVDFAWNNLADDNTVWERVVATLGAEERRLLRATPAGCRRPVSTVQQQHNSINRLSNTTGADEFAPFPMNNLCFIPGMRLAIFVLLEEEAADIGRIADALRDIGRHGFGRDASTGLGRFDVDEPEAIEWPRANGAGACLSLAPCVPEAGIFRKIYFSPFTRFGRHGAQVFFGKKPFAKNPVLMADEGAVLIPDNPATFEKPYIGRAISNVSKTQGSAVVQGYAPYLPMSLPGWNGG